MNEDDSDRRRSSAALVRQKPVSSRLYFDLVKRIPAAAGDRRDFLKQILERRGVLDLMDPTEVASIAKYSGGVLRDLLTLSRSSAEYAYRD